MIDLLILILVIAWLGGFTFHVAGGLIHILLIVALVATILRIAKRI